MNRILSGIPGLALGIAANMVNVVIASRLLSRLFVIVTKPPQAPYSLTYLLWFFLSILLWVLIAHTPVGDRKYGRIIAGVFTGLSIFAGLVGYALTWIGVAGYWPIMGMDLKSFGIESTASYAQGFMWMFVLFFILAFLFMLYEAMHSQSFWNGFFNWRIDTMGTISLVSGREPKLDVVVCIDSKTKKPVIIPEEDLTTNIMVQGATGTGKTSQILLPVLAQVLAHPTAGATVIEPKGTFAKAAVQMAQDAGKTYCRFINPEDPDTDVFNPLEGDDVDLVAAINDAMLSTLFGEQDAFFSKNQSVVAKNIILLLKYLHGDNCTYDDVNMLLLDSAECKRKVEILRRGIPNDEPKFSPRRNLLLWFDKEMFGENKEEVRRFTLGLRTQINELLSNQYLKRCIIGKSTIDMDRLLAEGGFLAVSTHDGLLKNLSKALGMVVLGHLQAAVERRPLPLNKRDESLKPKPHMIMLDEFGSYVNETFGQFMSKVREYNAPLCLAFQALSQMEEVGRGNNRAFREKVISLCRSKLWFPDVPPEDAKWYETLSGKVDKEDITTSTGTSTGRMSWFMPDSYRQAENTRMVEKPNHTYTSILEGKANTIFYRVMQKRTATQVNVGLVDFFDRDFSDPKRIVLPKSQFWYDRALFLKKIAERKVLVEKLNEQAEKARQKEMGKTLEEDESSNGKISGGVVESIKQWTELGADTGRDKNDNSVVEGSEDTPFKVTVKEDVETSSLPKMECIVNEAIVKTTPPVRTSEDLKPLKEVDNWGLTSADDY